jgi:para-aminobenzoate synthetase component I
MSNFPLVKEIDWQDPCLAFEKLPQQGALFLDSASQTQQGRYSYAAFAPFKWFETSDNPFAELEQAFADYQLPHREGLPAFQGGLAGVFSYELGGFLERIPRAPKDD